MRAYARIGRTPAVILKFAGLLLQTVMPSESLEGYLWAECCFDILS